MRTVETVTSSDALLEALNNKEIGRIQIIGEIILDKTVRLNPGTLLFGADEFSSVVFNKGSDGIQVTKNNEIKSLFIKTDPGRRAIYNDLSVNGLGDILFEDIKTIGQIQIIAEESVKTGNVTAVRVDILSADLHKTYPMPTSYGVVCMQGAFTIWNRQADRESLITARLDGVSTGRAETPICGCGIFVTGGGDERSGFKQGTRGRMEASYIEAGNIFTNSQLDKTVENIITAGLFIGYGAHASQIINQGIVKTYGVNDMMLDAWGFVDSWDVMAPLTSYGFSGNGIINFGRIDAMRVHAPLETFGDGARCFNIYSGSVGSIEFHSVITHGNGSVAIQLSRPLDSLHIKNNLETHGSHGDTLIKGQLTSREAYALNVEPGGSIGEFSVGGDVITSGDDTNTIFVDDAEIWKFSVGGDLRADGKDSTALTIHASHIPLRDLKISAQAGTGIRCDRASVVAMENVKSKGGKADILLAAGESVIHSNAANREELGRLSGNSFTFTDEKGSLVIHST